MLETGLLQRLPENKLQLSSKTSGLQYDLRQVTLTKPEHLDQAIGTSTLKATIEDLFFSTMGVHAYNRNGEVMVRTDHDLADRQTHPNAVISAEGSLNNIYKMVFENGGFLTFIYDAANEKPVAVSCGTPLKQTQAIKLFTNHANDEQEYVLKPALTENQEVYFLFFTGIAQDYKGLKFPDAGPSLYSHLWKIREDAAPEGSLMVLRTDIPEVIHTAGKNNYEDLGEMTFVYPVPRSGVRVYAKVKPIIQ